MARVAAVKKAAPKKKTATKKRTARAAKKAKVPDAYAQFAGVESIDNPCLALFMGRETSFKIRQNLRSADFKDAKVTSVFADGLRVEKNENRSLATTYLPMSAIVEAILVIPRSDADGNKYDDYGRGANFGAFPVPACMDASSVSDRFGDIGERDVITITYFDGGEDKDVKNAIPLHIDETGICFLVAASGSERIRFISASNLRRLKRRPKAAAPAGFGKAGKDAKK